MLVSVTVIETWVYGCDLLTGQRRTFQAYLGEVLDKLCNKRVWVAVRHETFGCLVIRHVTTTYVGTQGYRLLV